jgi:hypothetical protein
MSISGPGSAQGRAGLARTLVAGAVDGAGAVGSKQCRSQTADVQTGGVAATVTATATARAQQRQGAYESD